MPMHFLGGFWVGLLALYFFADELSDEKPFASILKVFIFVLIIGLGWEVFEFFTDKFLSQNPFNILDTASDIFFDLSGGLCAILYVWKRLQEKK